jgi:hypothetical protein
MKRDRNQPMLIFYVLILDTSELKCKTSAIALLDSKQLWDMHKPLEGDCTWRFTASVITLILNGDRWLATQALLETARLPACTKFPIPETHTTFKMSHFQSVLLSVTSHFTSLQTEQANWWVEGDSLNVVYLTITEEFHFNRTQKRFYLMRKPTTTTTRRFCNKVLNSYFRSCNRFFNLLKNLKRNLVNIIKSLSMKRFFWPFLEYKTLYRPHWPISTYHVVRRSKNLSKLENEWIC